MPKCHKFYPNCQWTVTHYWPDLALDIVLLPKVYWSYSTRIVRVCFTPPLKPTLKRDLKRKSNVQITFNFSAMESFYELFYSIYTIFTSFLFSSFDPSTRNNKLSFQQVLNFTMYSSQKTLECAIPIQLNTNYAEG